MLTKEALMKISLDECMSMLGKDLVLEHKELCCVSCGILSDGLFHYDLGLDTEEKEWHMGDEEPMEYYAAVIVNPESGEVTRDYENSTLPN